MQFQISLLQVDKISKTTSKGNAYFQIEVSYKELGTGKVASKKIMPFGTTAETHKKLMDGKSGDVFNITAEKGPANAEGKSFWEWVKAEQSAPGAALTATSSAPAQTASTGTAAHRSSYETAEERAARQVLIVKQSSLSAAVALHTAGAKTPPDPAKVMELAQVFTDFVFSKDAPVKATSVMDMADDLPD